MCKRAVVGQWFHCLSYKHVLDDEYGANSTQSTLIEASREINNTVTIISIEKVMDLNSKRKQTLFIYNMGEQIY